MNKKEVIRYIGALSTLAIGYAASMNMLVVAFVALMILWI